MLRINQIKLHPGHTKEQLEDKICSFMKINKNNLIKYTVVKQSVDARKKPEIFFSYTLDVCVGNEKEVIRKMKNKVKVVNEVKYKLPEGRKLNKRPVVVGLGPAGLFCGYILAKAGLSPVIFERGRKVETRYEDVKKFWDTGILDTKSNVQFGEGGAGTFSDGKLNTVVKDPVGRHKFVLETFVKFGAPENILYEQKPHIGTDILMNVVKNMREEIISLGGEIHFESCITDMIIKDNKIAAVEINNTDIFDTDMVVMAIGHSARDTFEMLYKKDIPMEAKSFAVGVRVEHPQDMINKCQYGDTSMEYLPTASYKLTANLANGRGVYTFCMCPGGYVVNASSEKGRLAVNGMSYNKRDGENANSAVIVTVTPDDFGSSSPLSGVTFQRELEENAYRAGNGKVPVQRFEDFCKNRISTELGKVTPNICGSYVFGDVRGIFPKIIGDSLEEGIKAMDKKIHGYAMDDAILSGVESRTSSPVRINRNSLFESEIGGLYPCGEGAGYAGGITSAAMDGIKVAEALVEKSLL